jgi:peptide/nickel transport system substrate-binding protein
LEHAVSKEGIIQEALHGAGNPIYTPILPGFLGYNNAIQGLAFDADGAKKALDNAGWSWLAGDSVRKKNGKELRFTLTTVDRPEYTKTAQMLRDLWAAIGVAVDIRLFSSNDILKKVIKPREYEALLFGEIIGTDPDPYPFWHSSQATDPGLNLAMYANKQVDQLLEEARQISDPEKRRLKYLHFQNLLADDQPAIFLYNPYYLYVLPQKIKGFTLERITFPSDRFNGIEKWYIKTRRGWR